MKDTLKIGLRHSARLSVDDTLIVPNVSPKLEAFKDMPSVFATAFMVGFIEATCIEAIAPFLEEGEHSVGTHIDMSHVAATPIGMTVTAEVELTAIDKRTLLFKVSAHDDAGLIGEGMHRRGVINVDKFKERVAQKAGSN